MICTYIFEDTTGQLGRWARYKKQDIVLHFSTIPRGGRNWAVSSYSDTGETKPESCIQCEYFDLVAAVVTHHRGRGIEAIYDSLKPLEREDDERKSLFLNKQSESLLIPREIMEEITIGYRYDVDFYTKPEYVTPLKINQNGDFDVSSGEETAYYMVSALSVVSSLGYKSLIKQANNILNINNVAHKKNKPFSKYVWHSYKHANKKLGLNGGNQTRIYEDLLTDKNLHSVSAMHELICVGDIYDSWSLEYIGAMEEITHYNAALPWLYATADQGNMMWEIYKANSPDYGHLKTYILVTHETFGVYTDSALGKKCAQAVNAWEKSSGLTFGDL